MQAFAGSSYFIKTVIANHLTRPIRVAVMAGVLLVSAGSLVLIPVALRDALEAFNRDGAIDPGQLCDAPFLTLSTCALVWIVSSSLANYLQEEANEATMMAARLDLYKSWLVREPSSDDARIGIISRITADASAFQVGLAALSHSVPLALIQMAAALVCMALLSLPLTGVFIVCLGVVAALLAASEARLIHLSDEVSRCHREMTSLAIEVLNNVRWIQRFCQEDNEGYRYGQSQEAMRLSLRRRRQVQLICRILVYLGLAVSLVVIALTGIVLAGRGDINASDIVAFVGLGLVIGSSIIALLDAMSSIAQAIDPLRRLSERFVDNSPPADLLPFSPGLGASIEISNLLHDPDPEGGKTFKLIVDDMRIAAGATIAFVGASGSGKSSLLKLIAGEQRSLAGRIKVDGRDLTSITRGDRLASIAYFDSVPLILSRTLGDNILFGRERSQSAIEEAIAASQLTDFVNSLPRKLETSLWFGQEGLSSGQRQRIALARSLLIGARVLLLDEAMSSIDSAAEREVLASIARRFPGATKVIVSHRLSSVRFAEKIFVFRAGRIVETGTHDELVALKGEYTTLFREQMDYTYSEAVDAFCQEEKS